MWLLSHADIPLSLVTSVLVWATINLARHTKALSHLTRELVKIEGARETRELREKRRNELSATLDAAKIVQAIDPQRFTQQLATPEDFPEIEVKALETLHAMKRYLDEDDTECHQHLEALRRTFDTVRREQSSFHFNETEVADHVRKLKGRLQWFIDNKSKELSISA
jgi:hypothetical protein